MLYILIILIFSKNKRNFKKTLKCIPLFEIGHYTHPHIDTPNKVKGSEIDFDIIYNDLHPII